MQRELAERSAATLLRVSSELNAILADAVERNSDVQATRRLIGKIMGYVYLDVLRPIFAEYPDLEPEALRGADNVRYSGDPRRLEGLLDSVVGELAGLETSTQGAIEERVAIVRNVCREITCAGWKPA